jgi:hypothetical protein
VGDCEGERVREGDCVIATAAEDGGNVGNSDGVIVGDLDGFSVGD